MSEEKEDRTVEILKIARELNDLLLKNEFKPNFAVPALLFVASSGAIFSGNSKEKLTADLSDIFDEVERMVYLTGMEDKKKS